MSGHLMKVEWKFRNNKNVAATLVGHPNQYYMYACRVGTSKTDLAFYRSYPSKNWNTRNDLELDAAITMATGTWYTATLSGVDGKLSLKYEKEDGSIYDAIQATFTTSYHGYPDENNMLLFEQKRTSSISAIDVDIAHIKIWQDGVNLTCELYPAVDDNGVSCMWDKVSNTLYYFGTPDNFEMSEVRI
jgi:hypothetical protein